MLKLLLIFIISQDTVYLTQDKAIELALQNNLLLKSSHAQVLSSKYAVGSARAALLPQVSFNASFRRISLVQKMEQFVLDSLVMTPGGAFAPVGHMVEIPFGQENNYNLSLQISQVLFSWGNLLRGYKIAKLNYDATKLSDSVNVYNVILTVKQLYISAIVAKEFYELTKLIDRELLEHYQAAKRRYEEGTSTELELLQAEVRYKNNKPRILEARTQYENLLELLKISIGLDTNVVVILIDSLREEVPEDTFTLEPEKRYDLRILETKMKMLELQKKIYQSSNLPVFFAAFNYLYQRPFGFEDEWKDYWVFTLGVNFPLFDGLKGISKARESYYAYKSIYFTHNFMKLQAYNEFARARKEYETALSSLKAQKENLRLARRLYDIAKKQYEEGVIGELDFIDAETNYFVQKANYLKSLAEVQLKWLNLEKVVKGIQKQYGK